MVASATKLQDNSLELIYEMYRFGCGYACDWGFQLRQSCTRDKFEFLSFIFYIKSTNNLAFLMHVSF